MVRRRTISLCATAALSLALPALARAEVLAIDGKKVTKTGEVPVGALPEGVVFSQDGSHLYVGNFIDGNVSILKVDGTQVTDIGKTLQLPGHPASMRGNHP